jgi:uncharacterized membrane protein YidH (DUF202 family)
MFSFFNQEIKRINNTKMVSIKNRLPLIFPLLIVIGILSIVLGTTVFAHKQVKSDDEVQKTPNSVLLGGGVALTIVAIFLTAWNRNSVVDAIQIRRSGK